MVSDVRQERGQLLAQTEDNRIKQVDGSLWFCPSEKSGGYLVNVESGRCSCPDSQKGTKCKHFWAVEFVRATADGTLAVAHAAKTLPKCDLTAEERRNVREALRFLRTRSGGWKSLAKSLRCSWKTLANMASRQALTAGVAIRVARLAGVPIDDVLSGKYPPAGTCPHCGRGPG
ncbi:MAG: SWIM zinc finger family protein [Candidatus Aenigmarchaeota archaeon]|nr:SWIM zinc finger family protein [Candidatus Aenigmarchaeota archaeon]